MVIMVQDNGVGIESDKLAKIKYKLENENESE